jgi:hypothetical protein
MCGNARGPATSAIPRYHSRSMRISAQRTLFTLDWRLDQNPDLRRRAHLGLNKGEARNALARAVYFCRLGEVRDRSFENQFFRASGGGHPFGALPINRRPVRSDRCGSGNPYWWPEFRQCSRCRTVRALSCSDPLFLAYRSRCIRLILSLSLAYRSPCWLRILSLFSRRYSWIFCRFAARHLRQYSLNPSGSAARRLRACSRSHSISNGWSARRAPRCGRVCCTARR